MLLRQLITLDATLCYVTLSVYAAASLMLLSFRLLLLLLLRQRHAAVAADTLRAPCYFFLI